MRHVQRLALTPVTALGAAAVLALAASAGPGSVLAAQALPNPYRMVEAWATLPGGRGMGAVGDVTVDRDGRHIWAVIRCEPLADPARFGDECRDSKADVIYKFAPDGTVVTSFGGGGMFIWPHGIDIDPDGNVWVTDAVAANRIPKGDKRGHQVVKFSPQGKMLMTLGMPGMAGAGPGHFDSPADVVVAPGGDIFVADGHNENGNNRVVRFSKEGKYITAFGKTGYGPGEFRTLHGITMDAQGRLFVADRFNNRVQIGCSSAGRAACSSTTCAAGSWSPTRSPTMCRTRGGIWAFGSATSRRAPSRSSSSSRGPTRARWPGTGPSSWPSIATGTSTAGSRARSSYGSTSE